MNAKLKEKLVAINASMIFNKLDEMVRENNSLDYSEALDIIENHLNSMYDDAYDAGVDEGWKLGYDDGYDNGVRENE